MEVSPQNSQSLEGKFGNPPRVSCFKKWAYTLWATVAGSWNGPRWSNPLNLQEFMKHNSQFAGPMTMKTSKHGPDVTQVGKLFSRLKLTNILLYQSRVLDDPSHQSRCLLQQSMSGHDWCAPCKEGWSSYGATVNHWRNKWSENICLMLWVTFPAHPVCSWQTQMAGIRCCPWKGAPSKTKKQARQSEQCQRYLPL